MARLFLFGIGGTGSRVIRSFTMMLAAGFQGVDSSLEIVPIIFDHDKGNGDLTRTVSLLNSYHGINKEMYPDAGGGNMIYKDSFYVPRMIPLNYIGVSTISGNPMWHVKFGATAEHSGMKYSDYIGLPSIASDAELKTTAALMEALYDDSTSDSPNAELNLELDKGFKGNPSIGTVVFDELKNDINFQMFLNNCNPGNGDRVFIIGSIFGGTGSSGIPVIVDEIRKSTVGNVRNVPIGVALVLPYFQLQPKAADNTEDTGAIDASLFNAKTKAALGAYAIGGNASFNSKVTNLYYIGDTHMDSYEYHEGKNKQQNPAHVVEWVAATSVIDFLLLGDHFGGTRVREFGIDGDETEKGKAINLLDIRDASKTQFVNDLTIFVVAMRYYLEVTYGSRNAITPTTSYYTTFDLGSNLSKGVYQKIKKFLEDPTWGFYKWLDELGNHDHALKMYNTSGEGKDIGNVLAHKTITGGFLSGNPLKDDNFSSQINNLTKHTDKPVPAIFFKALHDAAKSIFEKIKK